MKRFLSLTLTCLIATFRPVLSTSAQTQTSPRATQWKLVDDAVKKGLPQTAITNLQSIIDGALKDKAYPEALKAIGQKVALETQIQGNKPEEAIARLETEEAKAPKELVPTFDTLLAEWHWRYFQENRWRIMQRTQTAGPPGNDITTWDLPRILAEIDRRFQKALGSADTLKTIPISTYNDLLTKGTTPDSYRPTLYDFIAHEALAFYTSGEQAGAQPQDAFEISADDPILDSAEAFINWNPTTKDTSSPSLHAIRIFQDLLKFHHNDRDPSAFIDDDLGRLRFGKNTAVGDNKNARLKASFTAVAARWRNHELYAEAQADLAVMVREEDDQAAARDAALLGARAFPNSIGGKECQNLIAEIEAKEIHISTERVWNQPWPDISVRYRNLTRVYFRAVPYDWALFLQKNRTRPENLNDAERRELLAKPPALAWSADLPPATDYKMHRKDIPAPSTLRPGFYFIISSPDPGFGSRTNEVDYTDVWVTDLALIIRKHDPKIEGIVANAISGEPISGAQVDAWNLDNQGNRIAESPQISDTNGIFSFNALKNKQYLFRARFNGQEIATRNDAGVYNYGFPDDRKQSEETLFFTDRNIYRPGQTIQFKGICVGYDQSTNDYRLLNGQRLTVALMDANNKEVERHAFSCNDYGSFSGSFTAPRDRLTGAMSLQVVGKPEGMANFRVEEYKRPKFIVTIDHPASGTKLNEHVTVSGRAASYTGAAIDGASVSYTVNRSTQFPSWFYYGFASPIQRMGGQSQVIAHGSLKTSADGSFKIDFTAKADPKIAETNDPSFSFDIHADVTDSAGETRSASQNVQTGYTALRANLDAGSWQTSDHPVILKINTETLDALGQFANGIVRVHRLISPDHVQRRNLDETVYWWDRENDNSSSARPDLSSPDTWPLGEVAVERSFSTDTNGSGSLSLDLPEGAYRAVLETKDAFGKAVKAMQGLIVLQTNATKLGIKIPNRVDAESWQVEPGSNFVAVWGTGYDQGRAMVEIEHHGQIIERYWTKPDVTQSMIRVPVTESMRGGFAVHVTQLRENRAYIESHHVDAPWSNKELTLKWEHFTSKLEPGQNETWTAVVTGPNAGKAAAEMVATLYDASLDALSSPLAWRRQFGIFYRDQSNISAWFENTLQPFEDLTGEWPPRIVDASKTYRKFPDELLIQRTLRRGFGGGGGGGVMYSLATAAPAMPASETAVGFNANYVTDLPGKRGSVGGLGIAQDFGIEGSYNHPAMGPNGMLGKGISLPNLDNVSARKNLNETAFFFPHLMSDSNGDVRITFTMPEALTEWRFLGFAHDQQLRSGFIEAKAVTSRDLMVQLNVPRFVREGDQLEFAVKVLNQSDKRQTGRVRLNFNLARDGTSADKALGNGQPEQNFDIQAKESRRYSWKIRVPDGMEFLSYKAVAASASVSDGEEGYLPVLSRRVLVTESLPLPIRGPGTKKFDFARLEKAAGSGSVRNVDLKVEVTSNPAWYAVMALPYLMEFPHECSEQTFNRLYANALARHIATSSPAINRVFDQWRGTPALDSPLEKNADLKSVTLEETPWVRAAESKSQSRRNVGVLFDQNRLKSETDATLEKLEQLQLPDGSWPWFPGGRGDDYITLYVTAGFGRLRHLGVNISTQSAVRSLNRLDSWIDDQYAEILKHGHPDADNLSDTIALYLYTRSFFLTDKPIDAKHRPAVDYFLKQSRQFWLKLDNRQSQGHVALALQRFSDTETPPQIMQSLKERSVHDAEMGMFWRDTETPWSWQCAPIESQSVMIEAFDEIAHDVASVEDCKAWLLKQKQTENWHTTKATADAVYALLLRGSDLLAATAPVEISLGGASLKPESIEAGTGYFEHKFSGAEVKPSMGKITLTKSQPGIAWGSVHWQYLEDISKIPATGDSPLHVKKTLYVKRNTSKGAELEPVKGPLAVGDELVARIELRADRMMEYVHLKDARGSGVEPVDVLSEYRYQDGLGYYESTRDTASHFYLDRLPKGAFVIEYSMRVTNKGRFQSGLAELECMYAPEFRSHSESVELEVR